MFDKTKVVEQLKELKQLKSRLDYLKQTKITQEATIETLVQETTDLVNIQQKHQDILTAVRLILEKITRDNKDRLETFVTNALQEIFTDKNYALDIEIREDTKRPLININLVDNGVVQDVRDSVGGGIITTLGLLFQIYYLEVYNLNKVIFIDEGLKEVSKTNLNETSVDYLNNLLVFLKQLCQERQYKIIVITHDDSVRNIADKVYQVKQGEVLEQKR